jgi:predicted ATPase
MLTEVRFHNLKALEDVRIPLGRLTVLVGANGCGKSTALEGILRAAEAGRDEEGPRQASNAVRVESHATFGAHQVGLTGVWTLEGREVALTLRNAGKVQVDEIVVDLDGERWLSAGVGDAAARHRLTEEGVLHGRTARLFRFSVPRLREPSLQKTAEPRMDDDGGGMATLLATLLKRDRDVFERLEADLRTVVPQVRRVVLESAAVESHKTYGDLAAVDIDAVGRVTAPHLSEGTLLTLALLTELHRPGGADILLIDDLDRGLHPRAQAELLGCLRRLMEQRPTLQVVASAHSPYLLDHLRPEEVVVMALDGRSRAHARRLADHDDWPRMKGLLQTGEFWASVGEAWVTGDADAA